MPVRKREQRAQTPEEKNDNAKPPLKKINKMPDTPVADGSYHVKHFMMLDRAQVCPKITREHLRDMLKLPIKTNPKEKGLFEHLVEKKEEEKEAKENIKTEEIEDKDDNKDNTKP